AGQRRTVFIGVGAAALLAPAAEAFGQHRLVELERPLDDLAMNRLPTPAQRIAVSRVLIAISASAVATAAAGATSPVDERRAAIERHSRDIASLHVLPVAAPSAIRPAREWVSRCSRPDMESTSVQERGIQRVRPTAPPAVRLDLALPNPV